MEEESGVLFFDSTNMALKTERLLKSAGVGCTVIPTPVEITAECGISLLFKAGSLESVRRTLEPLGDDGWGLLFPFEKKRFRPWTET